MNETRFSRIPQKVTATYVMGGRGILNTDGLTRGKEYDVIGMTIVSQDSHDYICYIIINDQGRTAIYWAEYFIVTKKGSEFK